MNALQVFSYKGSNVTFSNENGMWVNATEMAKKFDRQPYDWLRLQSTKDFISALVEIRGFNTVDLVFNTADSTVLNSIGISNFIKIENGKYGGTWFHEDVAIEFARWLSPLFAIWCNDRIKEIIVGRSKPMSDDEIILQAMLIQQRRIERSGTLLKNNARKLSELRYRLEREKERRRGKYLLGFAESEKEFTVTIDMFIESPYFKVLNGATYLETIYLSFLDFCRASCIVCEDIDKKKISKRLLSLGYNKRHGRRGTFFELCEN